MIGFRPKNMMRYDCGLNWFFVEVSKIMWLWAKSAVIVKEVKTGLRLGDDQKSKFTVG